MNSHTGTHIDAPAHILPGTATLDQLPPETFIGSAFVLDVSKLTGGQIDLSLLQPHRTLLEQSCFLLLRTGWEQHWGEEEYFRNYPVLSRDAAEWLATLDLKGLGMDCISADPADQLLLPNHRILLGSGMVIIENLKNLGKLPEYSQKQFDLICLPLNIRDADGSPVRAMAILNN